ncbi:MAG: sigE 43 [Gemmataceae bacterium]|nr:sigE 43 [Gemmataceae bacterium]
MATTAHLLRLVPPADPGLTDGELLGRYASDRDEAAFAEVLRRNGPVVLRACQSVLGRDAGVEDAFQATFLLLACRAGHLTRPGSLAGWLHAAAVRTARTARRAETRRRRREQTARPPLPTPVDELTWREVREVLDTELAALPERYRVPLVLCYLQNLTHEEAARLAGCPVGALRGRLERGKARLRKRLARYGLPLAAPVLVLGPQPAVAAPLAEAALATARAGTTGGTIPRAVAGLLAPPARLKTGLLASAAVLASVVVALAAGGPRSADRLIPAPAPRPVVVTDSAPPPRTDPLGDVLPPGAVMRLGTRRFQVPTWPLRPVPLPGGTHYLIYHTDPNRSDQHEFRWMDAASGVVIASWPVSGGLHAVGASADGRWAVIAETKHFHTGLRTEPDPKTGPIRFALHDVPARKPVKSFVCQSDEVEGFMAAAHGACVSADGKWVATVNSGNGQTGRVRLWEAATGKVVWASGFPDLNGPKYTPLGFTPGSGELVLRASKDNRVHVVDTAKGEAVRAFPTMTEQIDGEVLAPDGSAVVLGTYSPTVRIWDLKTGKERAPLDGHKEWARRFAFTPDGKTLLTGGNDPFVLVRDWPSGTVRKRVVLGRGGVQELFASGDGLFADVLFWWESALARYDLETGKRAARPAGTHRAGVLAVAAAADGSVLSLGRDNVLRRWDPDTGRQTGQSPLDPGNSPGLLTLTPDGKLFGPCSISADGRFRAAAGADAHTATVEDLKTGAKVATLPADPGGWWSGPTATAFDRAGRLLATTDGEQVRLWSAGDWRPQRSIPAATSGLDFSPDGRMLVTTDLNDVTVWEVATRAVRLRHRPGPQWPCQARFSPDGRFLAWMIRSEVIQAWDVAGGRPVGTFKGHEGGLRGYTFTPDSTRLITASDDCTLLVWDVAGAAGRVPEPSGPPSEKDVQAAWGDMASADAARAFAGVRALAAAPGLSVPLIRAGVRPAVPVDAGVVDRLLVDLGNEDFATREKATAELIALGDRGESRIRAFLTAAPSPEARRRAGQAMNAITGPPTTPARLRELRAVEVLERAGTTGARELLRDLAKGNPDANLTYDAAAALRRLGTGETGSR